MTDLKIRSALILDDSPVPEASLPPRERRCNLRSPPLRHLVPVRSQRGRSSVPELTSLTLEGGFKPVSSFDFLLAYHVLAERGLASSLETDSFITSQPAGMSVINSFILLLQRKSAKISTPYRPWDKLSIAKRPRFNLRGC